MYPAQSDAGVGGAYEEQAPLVATHPFPVLTHPAKNVAQSASLAVEFGASVQTFKAHLFSDPNLHFPSLPFINGQFYSVPVRFAQVGKVETQPAPVVTHPNEKASHCASNDSVPSASAQVKFLQRFDVASIVHFLLFKSGVDAHYVAEYLSQVRASVHTVPSEMQFVDMAWQSEVAVLTYAEHPAK